MRSFVEAVCTPGGGACACTADELWRAMMHIIFADGATPRWEKRRAALHWLALPLAHALSPHALLEQLKGDMPHVVAT
eukprot:4474408-Prymnesium_polylepis.2